jgi:NAD(P)-dependent dehydrogenase (short-subunit alcohol dehydrogenase family)
LLLIRAALSSLRDTGGSVLNIGSINAYCGEPGLLVYSMSKGALMTMSRNLGDVLHREDGVRVNQLNVGWVMTANERDRQHGRGVSDEELSRPAPARTPIGRPLSPEAVAAASVYWIGDESIGVSGSVVEIEQYPVIGRLYSGERQR